MSAPRTSSERAERPPAPPALLPENDAVPSRERPPRADAVDTGEERLRKSMADLAERQRRSVAALEDRIMRSHLQVHRRVVRNDPVRERGLVQPLEGFGPQNPTIGNDGASLGGILAMLRDIQQRLEALEDQDDFRRPIGGEDARRPFPGYVRIEGKVYPVTGTVARYLWVSVTARTAHYSDSWLEEAPDGWEIYDLESYEISIPRLG